MSIFRYLEDDELERKIVQAFYKNNLGHSPSDKVWGRIEKSLSTNREKTVRNINILSLLKYVAAIVLLLMLPFYVYRDLFPLHSIEYQVAQHFDGFFREKKESNIDLRAKDIHLVFSSGKRFSLLAQDSAIISSEGNILVKQESDRVSYSYIDSTKNLSAQQLYHTLKVPFGKRISVRLLDGTVVYLNSGTEMKYPVTFNDRQMHVYLNGEAYFEVAKSKDRHFNVHVSGDFNRKDYIVQVLGTKFNIKALKNDVTSTTTLLEGSIQILGLDPHPILLHPSKEINVGSDFHVGDADIDVALAWKNHIFYFKQTPLTKVCVELEKWYGVKIRYQKTAVEKKLLGQISRDKSLFEVLDMLEKTQDIKYFIKGKEVYLTD
ncbi:FecR family protein [Sphingobacterium sp. LRF_L2]|uniref:FecR family protein n=1 Tax=Sphingobacterium sp. LRF_L2 TaxID=3369421 RepID=UPI003F5F82E2